MIRHIVLFKLKEFSTDALKLAAAMDVKKRLDELPSKIRLIQRYSSGIDIRNLSWSYDIVLTMDFDTMADLDSYTTHPVHQEFVKFNKDFSVSKVCADYEI